MDISKILDRAAVKAHEDEKFRSRLLKNANEVIQDSFKIQLPFKVTFHEFSNKNIIFVIPVPKKVKLNENSLENVAGGIKLQKPQMPTMPAMAYALFPRKSSQEIMKDLLKNRDPEIK